MRSPSGSLAVALKWTVQGRVGVGWQSAPAVTLTVGGLFCAGVGVGSGVGVGVGEAVGVGVGLGIATGGGAVGRSSSQAGSSSPRPRTVVARAA